MKCFSQFWSIISRFFSLSVGGVLLLFVMVSRVTGFDSLVQGTAGLPLNHSSVSNTSFICLIVLLSFHLTHYSFFKEKDTIRLCCIHMRWCASPADWAVRKWGSHQTLIQIKTHRQQGVVWLSWRLNKNKFIIYRHEGKTNCCVANINEPRHYSNKISKQSLRVVGSHLARKITSPPKRLQRQQNWNIIGMQRKTPARVWNVQVWFKLTPSFHLKKQNKNTEMAANCWLPLYF